MTEALHFDFKNVSHAPQAWEAVHGLGRYSQSSHHSTRSACASVIVAHVRDGQHGCSDTPPERGLHTGVEPQHAFLLDHLSHNIHRARVRAKFVLEPTITNEPHTLREAANTRT